MLPSRSEFFVVVFNTEWHIALSFIVRAEKTAMPVQPFFFAFNLKVMKCIEKQMWNFSFVHPHVQVVDLVVPVVAHDSVPVGIFLNVIFPKLISPTEFVGYLLSHV